MTSVQVYYEQAEVFNWLDAISGDNGSIDPKQAYTSMTLELHQVVTIDDNQHQPQPPRSGQHPSPQPSRHSTLNLRTLAPLKLEHENPVSAPRVITKSPRWVYEVISQHEPRRMFTEFHYEEPDSVSLATTATDSEYERCLLPFCGALPQPTKESSAAGATSSPSPSSSSNHQPQWLPLVVVQVVSSKVRKAVRALKRRLS
ncbi:hypothetical protein PENVUL_c053G00003 [Penicillium vulpinum]|uniref:Uncharacterized protein n=1 Tax=Penicillium vulpinum TaxID=29845 RepID=A0A1V6RG47_9EURO|nr:hypothetical protein PENVUL_c053G00003 [Penicillium vulpinum]